MTKFVAAVAYLCLGLRMEAVAPAADCALWLLVAAAVHRAGSLFVAACYGALRSPPPRWRLPLCTSAASSKTAAACSLGCLPRLQNSVTNLGPQTAQSPNYNQ